MFPPTDQIQRKGGACIQYACNYLHPGRNAATRKGLEMLRIIKVPKGRGGGKTCKNLSFLHLKGRTQKTERVHTKVATLQRNTLRRVATDNGGGKGLLLKLS